MVKRIFSARDLRPSRVQNSSVMKKIMANSRMARVLDRPGERRQLLEAIRKSGGSKQGVREALGELYHGSNDSLSKKEVAIIGREIGGGALGKKRYTFSGKEEVDKQTPASNKNNIAVSGQNTNQARYQATSFNALMSSRSNSTNNYANQEENKSDAKTKNIWTVLDEIERKNKKAD